jgi:hypothetical protein
MIRVCSSRIRIQIFYPPTLNPGSDPGFKKAPDPGSATLLGGDPYLGGEAAHLQHGVQPLAQQRRVVVQRAQDNVQLVNLHMRT